MYITFNNSAVSLCIIFISFTYLKLNHETYPQKKKLQSLEISDNIWWQMSYKAQVILGK